MTPLKMVQTGDSPHTLRRHEIPSYVIICRCGYFLCMSKL